MYVSVLMLQQSLTLPDCLLACCTPACADALLPLHTLHTASLHHQLCLWCALLAVASALVEVATPVAPSTGICNPPTTTVVLATCSARSPPCQGPGCACSCHGPQSAAGVVPEREDAVVFLQSGQIHYPCGSRVLLVALVCFNRQTVGLAITLAGTLTTFGSESAPAVIGLQLGAGGCCTAATVPLQLAGAKRGRDVQQHVCCMALVL
jgi:hypothetical protein